MQVVKASYIQHRGQNRILLRCPNKPDINAAIKKIAGRQYSKTYGAWHLPCDKPLYQQFKSQLPAGWELHEEGAAKTTNDVLPKTEKLKAVNNSSSLQKNKAEKKKQFAFEKKPICADNLEALEQVRVELTLKTYSPKTLRTYCIELGTFVSILGNRAAKDLQPEDLKRYMLYCTEKLKLSEHTLHSRINALKFYYEQVLKREKFFYPIPRPKKPEQLPKTFNQDEIASIINSVVNKKHKAMLMLAYGAGLRVGEIVDIKTHAFDSARMTIFISEAKGKKDRVVALSPVLLVSLREYAKDYKPDKAGYFFKGSKAGEPYSSRSLQQVLQAAKKKAGIIRPGSVHCLRHSFATHLVDRGTDVTMIQKLLGHKDIKTTLRYLHTSNKDLLKIISPLDDLNLK